MRQLKETRIFCLGQVVAEYSKAIVLPSQCNIKELEGGLLVS